MRGYSNEGKAQVTSNSERACVCWKKKEKLCTNKHTNARKTTKQVYKENTLIGMKRQNIEDLTNEGRWETEKIDKEDEKLLAS